MTSTTRPASGLGSGEPGEPRQRARPGGAGPAPSGSGSRFTPPPATGIAHGRAASSCADRLSSVVSSSRAADELDRQRQPVVADPGRHRGGRVAGDVPQRRVGDHRLRRQGGARRCRPVEHADLARPVRDRRGEQHVDVVEDPVGLRARPSRPPAAPTGRRRGAPSCRAGRSRGCASRAGRSAPPRRPRCGRRRRTAARTPASRRGSAGRPRARRGRGRRAAAPSRATAATWVRVGPQRP